MMTHFLYLLVFLPFTCGQGGGILGDLFGGGGNIWGQGRQSPGGWGQGWIPNAGDNRPPPPQSPQGSNPLDMIGQGVKDMLNQVGVGKLAAGLTGSGNGRDILQDFRSFIGQPPPSNDEWIGQARRFCRRFPGHPKCSGGQMPLFNDIQNILTNIVREGEKYLPKIPRIFIKDPLSGVNQELANVVREFASGLGMISPQISSSIKNICRSFKCQEQSQQTEQLKRTVLSKVYNFEKALLGKDTTDNINLRLDRTLQVKQALLEKANLKNEVVAADDGVFDKDLLLTEKQANFLLNELGKGGIGSDAPLPPGAKSKRASIFFEENLIQKWDINSPIPYTFHSSLAEYDKNDVRNALKEIEQKTCVRFRFDPSPRGYHINYQKVDSPTFCGLSYIGRVEPANPVYLSFQCGNARGIALHETLHALGLNHQHLRMDRDQHLTIDWSNINPQHYDYFVVADSKLYTTYGVKYDYGSIMHYNAYTGAVNIAKPTMIPKVNQMENLGKLGQRNGMSAADIEIVKKMYCMPGCDDRNVYCGAWALKELCNHPNHQRWMVVNCRKSCNFCNNG